MIYYETSIAEGENQSVIYYISDLHFGHAKVIAMDMRPFASIEEMDDALISHWNERVTECTSWAILRIAMEIRPRGISVSLMEKNIC